MLKKLQLLNFRGFEKHTLSFKKLTIIVGRNNAGKSTIVEALNLISIVVSRYRFLSYHPAPLWTGLHRVEYGISPSLKNTEINFDAIFYRYGSPPSIIKAEFADKSTIDIYLASEENIHAVIKDQDGRNIKSRSMAYNTNLSTVSILPQVGPVQQSEVILSSDYVKSSLSSPLAPSHFRNQINALYEFYPEFQKISEETWPGIQVRELIGQGKLPHENLFLEIRNEDFVAEISAMGHGLQMWLQTMWFLARSKSSSTVILDEPDVYMHADLQRRLIRFIKGRFNQVIIASHSIEIISEVDPSELLIVDRKKRYSKFSDSLPAVQQIVNIIGSIQNIHLARIWYSKKVILVEGKDIKILKCFQDILFPNSILPFDLVPNMSLGGWGGWNYAIGSTMLIKNSFGEDILVYCIFDSDYHTEDAIKFRIEEARQKKVELHIWENKEIENYLVNENVIYRVIKDSIRKNKSKLSIDLITDKIDEIVEAFESDLFDSISTEIKSWNKSLEVKYCNRKAREFIKKAKETDLGLRKLVSGKLIITELSRWSQAEFGVSLNSIKIAKYFQLSEIPNEVNKIVTLIEKGERILN